MDVLKLSSVRETEERATVAGAPHGAELPALAKRWLSEEGVTLVFEPGVKEVLRRWLGDM